MTDAPDYKTIDFAKVFSGQEYPKDTQTVIVNEKLGYEVHQIEVKRKASALQEDTEALKELDKQYEELAARAKDFTFTFHLTGISRELKDALTRKIRDQFDITTDVFGRAVPNEEAEKAYQAGRWALHTEKIVGPEGSEAVSPTPENLSAFLAGAPDRAIDLIEAKILELSGSGAGDGLDLLARDADFLS